MVFLELLGLVIVQDLGCITTSLQPRTVSKDYRFLYILIHTREREAGTCK